MNYAEYLLESLNRTIEYTEYVAESVNKDYVNYVAESVNKNIDYVNYLNGKKFNTNQISINRKEKISKIFKV